MKGVYSSPDSRRDSKRKASLRALNTRISDLLKAERGCEITGRMLPPEQLDWHHTDATKRRWKPSHGVTRSTESYLAELAQCVCLSRRAHVLVHRIQSESAAPLGWGMVVELARQRLENGPKNQGTERDRDASILT